MRAAVIGAGQIAKQHLAALAAAEGVQAVGVCDLSPVMAESTAERFGIERWYTDLNEMLEHGRPDVVHITTPPASHYPIAQECLLADCHVFVEKPATTSYADFTELRNLAKQRNRWLIEDHNYLLNDSVQEILSLLHLGELGEIRHVDVQICLDLFGPGSRFSDRDVPHPAMLEPAGVVTDFLTHLCYLAHAFVGEHRSITARFRESGKQHADSDSSRHTPCAVGGNGTRSVPATFNSIAEFQTLVDAQRGTALLGLSATSQPDAFMLRIQGTQMHVETNLFEVGTVRRQLLGGPQPLVPIRNTRRRAKQEKRNSLRSLRRKLSGGPGPYEGLWRLIAKIYQQLEQNGSPPIPIDDIDAVNRLVHDIQQEVTAPCAC